MRKALLVGLAVLVAIPVLAQEGKEMPAGIRGELIGQLMFVQGRILELEGAFPQELFSWRPAEGVRSVSEVFLHTAFGNYVFLSSAGYKIPEDANWEMNPPKWDTQTTDKDAIAAVIKKSFDAAMAAVKTMPEKDLDRMIKVFGMDFTIRNFSVTMIAHLHEHLGQAIAYGRMNGVVPPWTAKQQQEESKQN